MEVKDGMKFRGNKNNREILVLRVTNTDVQYQDLEYKTVFAVGRELFERCDITEIPTVETA